MNQTQPQNKRNATQRFEDLENAMGQFYQSFQAVARDVMIMRDAIKLLGNKTDAGHKLMNLDDNAIAAQMVQNNIDELRSKVDALLEKGNLVPSEVVTKTSFIVGQEVADDGEVVMPRTQFAVERVPENIQSKIIGAKAGDVLTLEEGKLKLSVSQVFEIVEVKVSETEVVKENQVVPPVQA